MIIINNDKNIPIYIQIYEQIKNEIITEQIPGDSKLPSIRGLSETLNVSRNTVENAYQQLSSEGYIKSKPGSGYFSLKLDSIQLLKPTNENLLDNKEHNKLFQDTSDTESLKFNFTNRCYSVSEFPLRTWKKLTNQCMQSIDFLSFTKYDAQFGVHDLQIELMKYLKKSRGVSCTPEQIIISSGMEYSLSLLCQLFREISPKIAIEDPGYSVAKSIFDNNGYSVLPIRLEKNGINVEELYKSSGKVVYVTPSHQFPTGSLMPLQKRLHLLEWATRKQGIIIEDDYDSEFRYNSRPIPSLQSIDSIGSVVYLGTFSKSLSPSIRIGYMVLPQSLLKKYYEHFDSYHVTASLMQQKILAQFMQLGYWDRHIRRIHINAIKKHNLLIQTIQEYMGDKVIIHGQDSGLHILLEFKNGLKEDEIIEKGKKCGVLVSPVSTYWMRKKEYKNNMIMLSYGGIAEDKIVEGIRTLSNAIFND
ncbi:PLP-dependent aminotransferase family protein [Tissierella sp. Yu-01]|uniref:MocR-like pyridoxine biosynthesis transcription factor PdxR n=1 Tax=Tissierella sp. Yu-01 TaxID=3035694 RepID=UPI00240D8CE7|nr:PLP-dependent aminotransferase family protein [Tissierella sp. Yu-01]WFA09330.1 PLP-dependent aminotransferase family protein [Tissierella sp. Yu-01]